MLKNSLTQQQSLSQQQTLSPVQVMAARLTELPIEGLRDRIEREVEENGYLEKRESAPDSTVAPALSPRDAQQNNDDDDRGDDWMPTDPNQEHTQREQKDERESLYDYLLSQMGEVQLSDHEEEVVRYLIGSLEDDGLLQTELSKVVDEMEVYHYLDSSLAEVERLLVNVVQRMEPAGVGARNLQECLILQVQRNYTGAKRDQLLTLLQKRWDDFSHARWERIQRLMKLDDVQLEELRRSVRKLTPRPGGSIGGASEVAQTITPDFIVTVDDDRKIHVRLNEGDLPTLKISDDAEAEIRAMPMVTHSDREAARFLRDRVQNAQFFLRAIQQRRESMLKTIRVVVERQRLFFREGDETLIRPMTMTEVAERAGLDVATVSRVAASKYVQTEYGTFPLRWFFSSASSLNTDEVTVRQILDALKQLVEAEDKRRPLSDEKLAAMLKGKGYAVARRTVAKYRTQLGIPESRLRS
ncbi:MAG: RNA polymerase factor sigma-54 [Bacteroidaceae bacterium]|nr:RNA polymerase factor sigma-54 [Bacteroidaceae bacterium]